MNDDKMKLLLEGKNGSPLGEPKNPSLKDNKPVVSGTSFVTINHSYLIRHDKTGKTAYSVEDKLRIVEDMLDRCMERMFYTVDENSTKVKGVLKSLKQFTVPAEVEDVLRKNILNALVYIGYTDGNFKNCDYLLCGEMRRNDEVWFLYTNIDNSPERSYGPLFSSLSNDIKEFGENHQEIDTNLYKMMKRNKYVLITESQKVLLFGKGHMSEPSKKVEIKRDLDRLFIFMKKSKDEVISGNFDPIEFDIDSLRHFKFKKLD